MQSLRICDIGLSADASGALNSMLKVLAGRTTVSWECSDIEHADVLVAHTNGDPATLAQWGATGKPVVLVIDDRCTWPPSQFVLRHPFRVMQLLSMLNDVAAVVSAPRKRTKSTSVSSEWAAAESLRHLMANGTERGWYATSGDVATRVWVGEGHAFAMPATIARLRAGISDLGVFSSTQDWPPDNAQRFALCDLAWFIGMSGPAIVPPWFSTNGAYRLRRWPDFGRLGAVPDVIQLCAISAANPCTPATLAQASAHGPQGAYRFLAAASLAGLLVESKSLVPVAAPAAAPAGEERGWMRLVGGLCRHLGFVA